MSTCSKLLSFIILLILSVVIPGTFRANTVISYPYPHLGIVPPNKPAANIWPPNPDYWSSSSPCTLGWSETNSAAFYSSSCIAQVLQAIDNAMAQEGVGPINLPYNWADLTQEEQLFIVLNLERVTRGLPPFVGLVASLDSLAQAGAAPSGEPAGYWGDPALPSNFSFGGGTYFAWFPAPNSTTEFWGGGLSIAAGGMENFLDADYEWMYNDGWGGSGDTANIDCSAPAASGCWGHRDNILAVYPAYTNEITATPYAPLTYTASMPVTLVMGAGASQPNMPGDPAGNFTAIFTAIAGNIPPLVYTWNQAVVDGAGVLSSPSGVPTVVSIVPDIGPLSAGEQVTVNGSDFVADATTVDFGSQYSNSVEVVSSNQLLVSVPPSLSPVKVQVSVTTPSGTSSPTTGSVFTYVGPPTVTSVSSTTDYSTGGATITIQGSNFYPGTQVCFGGTTSGCTFGAFGSTVVDSVSTLTVTVPPAPLTSLGYGNTSGTSNPGTSNPGTSNLSPGSQINVSITVVSVGGIASFTGGFTYVIPSPAETVSGISEVLSVPYRICDTRFKSGQPYSGQTLLPNTSLDVKVAGTFPVDGSTSGVPSTAVSAILTLTVVNPLSSGFLTVWPSGSPKPLASVLNWAEGQTVANTLDVALGEGGQVSIYNGSHGSVNVVVDVSGYGTTALAEQQVVTSPIRIADTRLNSGYPYSNQELTPYSSLGIDVAGVGGIPTDAVGVVANIVAVNPLSSGFLTVWPGGSPKPLASVLNWAEGQTVSDIVSVALSTGGEISVYNGSSGSVDLVVDVLGWYVGSTPTVSGTTSGSTTTDGGLQTSALLFTGVSPSRICDTRSTSVSGIDDSCSGHTLGPWSIFIVDVAGQNGIPVSAKAVLLNVTVTNGTDSGYITICPDGYPIPLASNSNWTKGQTVAETVLVPLSQDGKVQIYNGGAGSTDVVIDVEGWYE